MEFNEFGVCREDFQRYLRMPLPMQFFSPICDMKGTAANSLQHSRFDQVD
jgi:hypothetical protein